MRDPIVVIAMAGTSRQERVQFTTGTPVDALVAALPEGEVERSFLLGAGALAVYRQAGAQAQQLADAPLPAAQESVRECSPDAALLLSRLLNGDQSALLPEALARMREKGLRLPFRLLPLALNASGKETRAALFPLLGERGRWLSQFNKSWNWVHNYLVADEHGLPADAETIWQEGTLGQRVEILRRLRASDPAQARAWLEGVWKQEKAEARGDLIDVLEIGLSADDEAFLEKALDDRSGGVRATAANWLARLPNSAFSMRMHQRGQDLLRVVDGRIEIDIPAEFVMEWRRDGILGDPPRHISKRSWWLVQILAAIEPTFWETHLGAPPAELLKLLPLDNEWTMQVLEGWSKAAMSFHTQDWLSPLWSWWYEHYQESVEKRILTEYGYREHLLKQMPGQVAERLILDLIVKKDGELPTDWWELLSEISRPWSVEFAQSYLWLMRERCTLEKIQADTFNPYADPWFRELPAVALSLPEACFVEALQPWDILEEDPKWQTQYAREQIKEFSETVHMRQKINEEIL